MQRNVLLLLFMGTCMSSCKGSVPNSEGNASPSKVTAPNFNSPSHTGVRDKIEDESEISECARTQIQSIDPEPPRHASPPREDKRIIIHETVREADAGDLLSSLKENRDANLMKSVKSGRRFTGKASNEIGTAPRSNGRQTPVKTQARGDYYHTKSGPVQKRTPAREPSAENLPSLRRTASSSSRRIELQTCRVSQCRAESKPAPSRKISVPKGKGNASPRSGTGALGVHRNPSPDVGKGRNLEKPSRMRSNEEVGAAEISEIAKDSISDVPMTTEEDDEKSPTNCHCGDLSERQGDSNLPPIDLENPLISLDCFIFL